MIKQTNRKDSFISGSARTAAQTAVLMAILTLLSKGFGFVREMVMANFFGASYITDAYVMAIAIPGILFGGIFGSVATSYMPLYSKIAEGDIKELINPGKNEKVQKKGSQFTSEVISLLVIVSAITALIGFAFSDQIVAILASGFSGETAKLTSLFTKVTFCYVIFTSTAGVLEAYLQYRGVFLVQVALGYVYNIILIGVIIICAFTSHYYLAIGGLLGYMVRAIVLLIVARKKGLIFIPTIKFNKTIRQIIAISFPVFLSSGILQINIFIDKTLASRLPEGCVAALNYGMILIGLITGLTIGILTTILYPKLNQANSLNDYERFSDIVSTGVALVAIVAIPCTLGVIVYNYQIVQIVYERGAFNSIDTALTASAFFYYSIGLLFTSLNDLMVRAYYSMHDMKTPMIYSGISVIINLVLNLILVQFMGLRGLALATSIAFMVNTLMLFIGMKRKYPHIEFIKLKSKILKIVISSFTAVGLSYGVYASAFISMTDNIYTRIIRLGMAIVAAGIVYLVMLVILKIDEVKMIKQIIKK